MSNETNLHCLTNHLSTFSGNFYVAPNKIDLDRVLKEITRLPPENMVVLFTVCLIFLVYAVGLVFVRRADKRDKKKVGFPRSVNFLMQLSSPVRGLRVKG